MEVWGLAGGSQSCRGPPAGYPRRQGIGSYHGVAIPRTWEQPYHPRRWAPTSSDQVTKKAKETLKIVRELLEKAEDSTHRVLERAAPAVQKSVDASMEAAAKGFSSTMKSIDGVAARDQVKLLRAYRKFLSGQADLVESRIRALERKSEMVE